MKKFFIGIFVLMFLVFSAGISVADDTNNVMSMVDGESFHDIVNDYGNNNVGGFGKSYGYGSYFGKVKDFGSTAAENWICGQSTTAGNFTFSGELYSINKPDCCSLDLGPFENVSNMYSTTESDASIWGIGTLKRGNLKAEGEVGIGTWTNSVENDLNWAGSGQELTSTYKVVQNDPCLGSNVSGWAEALGGSASYANLDNNGTYRHADVGSITGNETKVRAYGGDKYFTISGSGGASGQSFIGGQNFGGMAGGMYDASFAYNLRDHRGYPGWDANGSACGNTGATISKFENGMVADSYSHSGSYACPDVK